MAVDIVAPGIMLIRDAAPWATDLVAVAKEIDAWKPSTQVNEHGERRDDYRSCHEMCVSGSFDSRLAPFEDKLFAVVGNALLEYRNYNKYCQPSVDQGYNLLRYRAGEHYREHVDWQLGMVDVVREVSISIGLNEDYEGGEIEFPLHKLKMRVPQGAALVFPSFNTHPHIAHEVTDGERYVVVTWVHRPYRLNLLPL